MISWHPKSTKNARMGREVMTAVEEEETDMKNVSRGKSRKPETDKGREDWVAARAHTEEWKSGLEVLRFPQIHHQQLPWVPEALRTGRMVSGWHKWMRGTIGPNQVMKPWG